MARYFLPEHGHKRKFWKVKFWFLLTQMDSLNQNCEGSLICTFSLGATDTKLDLFWCFFLMAEGEILIPVDTDGFLDSKLWGVVNAHFFSRTNRHQAIPILVLFLNGQRWNFDFRWHRWIPWPKSVLIHTFFLGQTDTKLDPFWWGGGGLVNSHFFSRTNRHQAIPILVLFLNGQRWNFDFRWHRWIPWPKIVGGS